MRAREAAVGVVLLAAASLYMRYRDVTSGEREHEEDIAQQNAIDDARINDVMRLVEAEHLEHTPQRQADERAAALLPMHGSEDMTRLLVMPQYTPEPPESMREYRPNNDVEWTVEVRFDDEDEVVTTSEFAAVFDRAWIDAHERAATYGLGADSGRWTYVYAAGAPTRWKRFALSFSPNSRTTPAQFDRFMQAVRDGASRLHDGTAHAQDHVTDTLARVTRYDELAAAVDDDCSLMISLVAPTDHPFDGRTVWDVMQSLGLKWGDSDEFHWVAPQDAPIDSWFSVGTSSGPGYFLPEMIANNELHCEDVSFEMIVTRTPHPDAVLTEMIKAAKYAQRRLGGTLVTGDDVPFDEAATRSRVMRVVNQMRAAQLEPGSETALRLLP